MWILVLSSAKAHRSTVFDGYTGSRNPQHTCWSLQSQPETVPQAH